MSLTNRIWANSFAVFDATLLTNVYQLCDPGLPQPSFLIRFVNTSNVNIFISYDGINDHDIVLAHDQFELSLQVNNQPRNLIALMAKTTPVYVKYELGVGKGGYLYVISYYQL